MKRKVILMLCVLTASVAGHVAFGTVNPNHPDIRPPQLWWLALAIGVVLGTSFLAITTLEAWLLRRTSERIGLVSDCILFAVFGVMSFMAGQAIQAI